MKRPIINNLERFQPAGFRWSDFRVYPEIPRFNPSYQNRDVSNDFKASNEYHFDVIDNNSYCAKTINIVLSSFTKKGRFTSVYFNK